MQLRSLGYMNTFGVDAADSFLEESRKKEVYLELEKHRFGIGLKAPYNDSTYQEYTFQCRQIWGKWRGERQYIKGTITICQFEDCINYSHLKIL